MDDPGPFQTGAKSLRLLGNHPAHMIGTYANNAGQQRMFCQYGRQVSHAAQHGQAVNLRALFGQVVDITNGPETRRVYAVAHHGGMATGRSEEHTSELQSPMRISYAVFCLKQNKDSLPNPTLSTN